MPETIAVIACSSVCANVMDVSAAGAASIVVLVLAVSLANSLGSLNSSTTPFMMGPIRGISAGLI